MRSTFAARVSFDYRERAAMRRLRPRARYAERNCAESSHDLHRPDDCVEPIQEPPKLSSTTPNFTYESSSHPDTAAKPKPEILHFSRLR